MKKLKAAVKYIPFLILSIGIILIWLTPILIVFGIFFFFWTWD